MTKESEIVEETISDINTEFDRQKSQEEILIDQLCEG